MSLVRATTIRKAAKHLRAGHLVIYPTETSYAFGADATNEQAVKKIFEVKGRAAEKALPLIVADERMARRITVLSPLAMRYVKLYWPGALTLILPVRRYASIAKVGRKSTVALRVSSHPTARALARALGRPFISTSANLSGQSASYSLRRLKKYFGRSTETIYFLDGGTLPRSKPSTIIDCTKRDPVVVRQGSLKISFSRSSARGGQVRI